MAVTASERARATTTGVVDRTTVDRFVAMATEAGSVVHQVRSLVAVGDLARSLADGGSIVATTEVADDPALATALGPDLRSTDDAAEVADRPVAVERGVLGVAETGSVLVREPDRASRLATMLARQLIQVVGVGDVVASLDDAGAWLATHAAEGYAALITGPSRTADIERVLTVGVQGPAVLHVVLLDDAAPPSESEPS